MSPARAFCGTHAVTNAIVITRLSRFVDIVSTSPVKLKFGCASLCSVAH